MQISFSKEETYLFYLFLYLIILGLLFLSEYIKKRKIQYTIYFVVCMIIFLIITFREVGVDRSVYIEMYKYTPLYLQNYRISGFMEPVYFIVNLVAYYIFENFIFVQALQGGLIAIAAFYVMTFCRKQQIDVLIVFMFSLTSTFFYFMGLNRMSIACSILAIVMIKFLKNHNVIKLLVGLSFVVLAHYSALLIVGLFILLFIINKRKIKWLVIKIGYCLPVILYVFLNALSVAIVSFLPQKYWGYIDTLGFNITYLKNVIYIVPLICIYHFTPWLKENNLNVRTREYVEKGMAILICLVNVSLFFNGAFRITFYLNYFVAYLYAYSIKNMKIKPENSKILIKAVFVLIMTIYSIIVFFDSPYITEAIVPFSMSF